MNALAKRRPKHLDLAKIRLPMPGFVSILHRVSGALMFLLIPLCLYLLDRSLASPDSYAGIVAFVEHPLVKLILLALTWAFLHHLCAGIRFLLLDLHVGGALPAARSSSAAVLAVSLILTLILGVKLW
ncbi:MAG: succinate dehydrogenase, cytochrome b556 subunit [Burkholderiales bacterium]|nr:succinate dehydrogenase, cytochrome b556 subunit [Betaproteobacteria bacterium]